jgi:hypothetical protein
VGPCALLGLLTPYSSDEMEAYRVSTLVNSTANDLPECVNPLTVDREDAGPLYAKSLFDPLE